MLTKLAIHAFKDEHLRKHVRDFKLQVNPEKVTRSFKNQYVDVEGVTGPVQIRQFAGIGQAVLNLEFVIDATGIVPGVDSVREKIRELRATACDFEGDTHTAPYLRVVWGDLNFPCRFDSMSIDYNLFSPRGIPLRAKVTAQFTRHDAPDTQLFKARPSSPDLTHARVVRDGDTLPLLCEEIYREDRYYPQVARFNNLDNLVVLKPGTVLSLPPLRD